MLGLPETRGQSENTMGLGFLDQVQPKISPFPDINSITTDCLI